ncbi:hypothetical protein KL86DYS1_11933 [uncultured Dysgonomonas sp.]|uniref:Uncharacterized protein n=1 Tax=uncultured Dysgonomonas sp. TaxID=206096 RepID=A0A212JDI9_9BACT|nr:hypothetical protein KL86DYS1_11933 [uncultured Dysgonomonas sp.]
MIENSINYLDIKGCFTFTIFSIGKDKFIIGKTRKHYFCNL